MTDPHASWASVYDIVYEQSFSDFYHNLTNITIDTITKILKPPSRIVDFGAGTGRLSIPLASMGYDVLAVEPCREMLDQLVIKQNSSSVNIFHGKIQDFQTDVPFDMAICVFTVLLYLLDEQSLKKSIQAAANALSPEGLMLIDIPSRAIFQSYQRKTQIMDRSVSISQSNEVDIYQYTERTSLKLNGREDIYTDNFEIKYWSINKAVEIFVENGFSIIKNLSSEFSGAGSSYLLLKKCKKDQPRN